MKPYKLNTLAKWINTPKSPLTPPTPPPTHIHTHTKCQLNSIPPNHQNITHYKILTHMDHTSPLVGKGNGNIAWLGVYNQYNNYK